MIGIMTRFAKPGQCVKFRGHNIHDALYFQWWKVTANDGTSLTLVNRHGQTAHLIADMPGVKAMVWEPGDDCNDEDPNSLPR